MIVDGRVYSAAPGLRTLAWCLDLDAGTVIWRTQRCWQGSQTSASRRCCHKAIPAKPPPRPRWCWPIGSCLANSAPKAWIRARRLLWIDRQDGQPVEHPTLDEADYRLGSVALAGHADCIVAPTGTQRIEPFPPQIGPQDYLVGVDPISQRETWRIRLGPMRTQPVLDAKRAYVGTADGRFFAINLHATQADTAQYFGHTESDRIAWSQALGGGAGSAAVSDDLVVVGDNSGQVWAFDPSTGAIRWQQRLTPPEPAAQQLFSPPAIADDRVVIGSAHGSVHCLDRRTARNAGRPTPVTGSAPRR